MHPRSTTSAIAAVLVAIVGGGFAFVGVLLLAIGLGAVPFLDPVGIGAVVVGLLGIAALAVAGIAFAGALGLWAGRSGGWGASLGVAILATIGAAIALDSAGPQAPVIAGLVLTVSALVLLASPSARSAGRVGA